MFCSNCGSKLPEGAKFCSVCGTRVAESIELEAKTVKPFDLDFSEELRADAESKPAEAPLKTRVTFDWSNVIDEPQRKTVLNIKSPWSTTGELDEKDIYSEMTPSTERSRTMSFIDVMRAEKEQARAEAADNETADAAESGGRLDYTEVLEPGYLDADSSEEPEAVPELHIAPLYEDLDEPVVTPYDEPEEEAGDGSAAEFSEAEAVPAGDNEGLEPTAPYYSETSDVVTEAEADVENEFEAKEDTEVEEEQPAEEVSDDTDTDEPEADLIAENPAESPDWFVMPDFLKPKAEDEKFHTGFVQDPGAETADVAEPAADDEPAHWVEYAEPEEEDIYAFEEPEAESDTLEEVIFSDEPFDEDNVEVTKYHELGDLQMYGEDYIAPEAEEAIEPEEAESEEPDVAAEPEEEVFEEPEYTEAVEEAAAEEFEPEAEPVAEGGPESVEEDGTEDAAEIEEVSPEAAEEEPAEEPESEFPLEAELGTDFYSYTEDEYLNIDTQRTGRTHANYDDDEDDDEAETYDEITEYEESDFDDVDEPVDEAALFSEIDAEPKRTGMTIAAPADKESEIEALKRRLAELMGTEWEPEQPAPEEEAEEAPADEIADEAAEIIDTVEEIEDTAEESVTEEPETEAAEGSLEGAAEAVEAVEEESAEPEIIYEDLLVPEEPADLDAAIAPTDEIPDEAAEIIDTIEEIEEIAEEPVTEETAEEEEVEAEDAAAEELNEEVFEAADAAEEAAEVIADDVDIDSYLDLPEIEESVARVDAEEGLEETVQEIEEEFAEPEEESEDVPVLTLADLDTADEVPEALEEAVIEEIAEEVAEPEAAEPEAPEIAEVVEDVEEAVEEASEATEEPAADHEPTIDEILAALLKEGEPETRPESGAAAITAEPEAIEAVIEKAAEFAEPEIVEEAVEPVEITAEEIVETAAEAVADAEVEVEEAAESVTEATGDISAVVQEVAPAAADTVIEVAEAVDEAATEPEVKESDALTLEELEKDLFGEPLSDDSEIEATKKIDKFYTLYRKNEEFQKLLDEEYNKLKAAGGPVPEQALPDPEPPASAAAAGKMIEDATIYQDFEIPKELIKDEAAGAAPADAVKAGSDAAPAAVAVAAVAAAGAAAAKAEAPEVEYEEVDRGGGFLTVLAVIVALLLVVLLAVILILQFAPDSGIALQINSIIENITSHFTAVDTSQEFLL